MALDKHDYAKDSLKMHYEAKGKIEVVSAVPVRNSEDLSLAYTPGVAAPCLEIQKDIRKSYELTRRWNLCLVVTDGTAVLGLEISVRRPLCRLWRANVYCSNLLAVWMHFHSVSAAKMWMRL